MHNSTSTGDGVRTRMVQLPFTCLEGRGDTPVCLSCGSPTSNPKFCSRSCAATYNNQIFPKRKPTKFCIDCQAPIPVNQLRCSECFKTTLQPKILKKNGKVGANGGRNPYIRESARKTFRKDRPQICSICEYNYHIDVCHIKDINTYPDGTPYSIINDPSNLIGLCPNHHWEFDHNVL